MSIKKIITAILAVTVLLALLIFAIFMHRQPTGSGLQVVATHYPLYEFAKQVGGDRVTATNITPPGAEPHDFEPSPQDLARAQNAKVLIYNGANFEPWSEQFAAGYKGVAVKASQHIELNQNDPHFWLDPMLAAKIIDAVRDGLTRAQPADADYFAQRAQAYKAELAKLDHDFSQGLQTCRLRTVVSAHDAFGYLAKRYNLEVVAIAGISPEEEPSPAHLAELSQFVKNKGITHIFYETLGNPRLAQIIATETDTKTAKFDPIEGLTKEDETNGKSYITIQRENLAQLRNALACQ